MRSKNNSITVFYSELKEKTQTPDEIRYLHNLESKAVKLLTEHGARQCPCCKEIKINAFPFFDNEASVCSDCQVNMVVPSFYYKPYQPIMMM